MNGRTRWIVFIDQAKIKEVGLFEFDLLCQGIQQILNAEILCGDHHFVALVN